MDVAASRRLGNAHDLADLLERQAFVVAERDRRAVLRSQLGQRGAERRGKSPVLERIGLSRCRRLRSTGGRRATAQLARYVLT